MALENIVIGSELSPQDFVFNEATQMFELNLADGMARNPSGVWGINAATLEAMIAAAVTATGGLDVAAVQAIIDSTRRPLVSVSGRPIGDILAPRQ